MTLIKAYSNTNDFEYYKKFCKEGVTNKMVSLKRLLVRLFMLSQLL